MPQTDSSRSIADLFNRCVHFYTLTAPNPQNKTIIDTHPFLFCSLQLDDAKKSKHFCGTNKNPSLSPSSRYVFDLPSYSDEASFVLFYYDLSSHISLQSLPSMLPTSMTDEKSYGKEP